jgi:hypothetical protein
LCEKLDSLVATLATSTTVKVATFQPHKKYAWKKDKCDHSPFTDEVFNLKLHKKELLVLLENSLDKIIGRKSEVTKRTETIVLGTYDYKANYL